MKFGRFYQCLKKRILFPTSRQKSKLSGGKNAMDKGRKRARVSTKPIRVRSVKECEASSSYFLYHFFDA
jgi:hypothetical protein